MGWELEGGCILNRGEGGVGAVWSGNPGEKLAVGCMLSRGEGGAGSKV